MTVGSRWTDEEHAILAKNYPQHGRHWDGWKTLLPGRSVSAIYQQAYSSGLTGVFEEEKPKPEPKKAKARQVIRVRATKDPYEDYVLACMKSGLTPSQVDSKLKWKPGKTVLVLTTRWYRLKSGGYLAQP